MHNDNPIVDLLESCRLQAAEITIFHKRNLTELELLAASIKDFLEKPWAHLIELDHSSQIIYISLGYTHLSGWAKPVINLHISSIEPDFLEPPCL